MAKVTLYIAVSLDGCIARKNGDIDWLSSVEDPEEDYGYEQFYSSVDALVMGRATYQQVLTFGDWPYEDKPTVVLTGTPRELTSAEPSVSFSQLTPRAIVGQLESGGHEHIWLVGGGKTLSAFLEEQLVDEWIISTLPVLLGSGIPLFESKSAAQQLQLVHSQSFPSGLVQSHYRRGAVPESTH